MAPEEGIRNYCIHAGCGMYADDIHTGGIAAAHLLLLWALMQCCCEHTPLSMECTHTVLMHFILSSSYAVLSLNQMSPSAAGGHQLFAAASLIVC
jgi:hypothetical protein